MPGQILTEANCFKTLFSLSDLPMVKLQLGPTLNPLAIKEGDDVYFECKVTAKPRAFKIDWKYNVSTFSLSLIPFVGNVSIIYIRFIQSWTI